MKHIFAILLLISFPCCASADLLVKSGEKIAFLGDSITAEGWEYPGGYVKLTTAGLGLLGVNVIPIPAGIGGNTSKDMLGRFTTDVLAKKPDWLTLSCGVNDVWHGSGGCTLDEYKKNITSMVDQAQAAGIKVLIMTSTVIGEDDNDNNKKLVAYNDFLRQLATERHLPVAEENAAFQTALKDNPAPAPRITMDGVHPNSDGSQIMAKALLSAFGASPEQIEHVQQVWTDVPGGAWAHASIGFTAEQSITIRQFNALKALATSRKTGMVTLMQSIYMECLDTAIQAHKTDVVMDAGQVTHDANQAFTVKIAELTK